MLCFVVVLFLVEADADCLAVGSRWTAALAALAGMASQMQGPCSSVNTGMFILGGFPIEIETKISKLIT